MISIGKINRLIVHRETDSGYYLKKKSCEDEVFMPPVLVSNEIKIDQILDVFVYLDSKGRMLATCKIPVAEVDEYALLQVIEVQEFGAFFKWGIEKDLLVPGNEQKIKVRKGEWHLVRICLEEETNRVYGTTKLGKYIQNSQFDIQEGDEVDVTPVEKTDLGYRSIINKKFIGLIYHGEIFTELKKNEGLKGIIKKIREDGLVDIALQSQGFKNLLSAKEKILEMLKNNQGESSLNDKSDPLLIQRELGMSKQTFKRAIGMLYKEKKIKIDKDKISLTKRS